MTPEESKTLAEPIVDVYAQLTDELMGNIAAQLGKDANVSDTDKWQRKKMEQLGVLAAWCLRIIAKRTKNCPARYQQAVITAAKQAQSDTDKRYRSAIAASLLNIPLDFPASTAMMNALRLYRETGKDLFSLVNTTMAYKARDAYTGMVNKVADLANRDEYIRILGKNTASAVTGIQSRQAALRRCLEEFSAKGMPGFVDKAGREWAPESYINMNIRSAVNRVANDAQFARMEDYGNDLAEVSSHIGARPRCEPFQGRIYSRSGKSGFTEDLNGNKIQFYPWSSTSYGEPGGLLGINCGHQVYPFIPGLSRQTYTPYDKAENDSAYKDSQRQRALERKVRESKRECTMLDAAGDKEGFEKASVRLKRREAGLKEFARITGRTLKVDRVQVQGYTKAVSGKTRSAQTVSAKKSRIRADIRSGQYPLTLNPGHQKKHINPEDGRSYIYGGLEDAQKLVDKYHGTGELRMDSKGNWTHKEFVTADIPIGVYRSADGSIEEETSSFRIDYSLKKGVHIIPTKEMKK